MYEQKPETAFAVHEDSPEFGSGYVKLYRDALTHRYFSNPHLWHFYLYCILRANYTERKIMIGFQTIELDKGQFIFGRNQCSLDTGLSIQNIRTCLKVLEKEQKLTIKVTSKFSLISVINFDSWQNGNSKPNHQSNQQLTINQPSTNHRQEGKEGKEKNKGAFTPPTLEEVSEYCRERNRGVDPVKWFNFYGAKNWMIGKNKMSNWKLAVCTWEKETSDVPQNERGLF